MNCVFQKSVVTFGLIFEIILTKTNPVNAQPCNITAGYNYTIGANGATTLASTSSGTNANTQYYWKIGPMNVPTFVSSSLYSNPITFTFFTNSIYQVSLVV